MALEHTNELLTIFGRCRGHQKQQGHGFGGVSHRVTSLRIYLVACRGMLHFPTQRPHNPILRLRREITGMLHAVLQANALGIPQGLPNMDKMRPD